MVTINKAHNQAITKLLNKPLDNAGIQKVLQKFTPSERTLMMTVVMETMRRDIATGWEQGMDVNAASKRLLTLKDQVLSINSADRDFFKLDRPAPMSSSSAGVV